MMWCGKCNQGYKTINDERKPCRPCHRVNRAIQEYTESLASMMGLADWTIEITFETCASDAHAEIECVYGQRLARISVSENWPAMSREAQRDTLVHELVHALLAPLSQMAYDMVNSLTNNEGAQDVAKAALTGSEEWVVDPISIAWAKHLPLPEEEQ